MFRVLRIAFVLLLPVLMSVSAPAFAQSTYPAYEDIYLNDYASLVDADDATYIRNALQDLRTETGVEFTVLTISSLSDYGHDGAIEPFATGLFNTWGIGDKVTNDGILMLVSLYDRKIRIELGAAYGNSENRPMKYIIDTIITPEFKNESYSKGIRKGVDAVIYNLNGVDFDQQNTGVLTKVKDFLARAVEQFSFWLLGLLVPIFGGLRSYWKRGRRNRPRICPNDGLTMSRLSEDQDDEHLEKGQITEELLQSVDYDVWVCGSCDHITVEAYPGVLSRYGACRACKHRTLEGDTEILSHATTNSTGSKRINYQCHHCHEAYCETKTIPIKSKSSSGSSFGGGSSSGGGASGSW
ncbi:TPM domain-containing protein [Pacificibacter sp. AS14]|uniref:TPM domain-containing protein n=1 Tax=Pacificibacter sp. AS14 TaxID=3135785 RepID=UPI003176D896